MALNCTALVKRQLQNYKMMYHILDTCQQAQCALVRYRLNPFTEFKGLKEMTAGDTSDIIKAGQMIKKYTCF